MQELPTEDLCKTSPAAEKDAPEAIVLNWFEQFWTTGWLWTNALNLSKNDRSTLKWSGLSVETVQHHFDCASFPSQLSRCMLRWWRQKYQRRQRPNTSQNNACVFFENCLTRPDLVASKSFDWLRCLKIMELISCVWCTDCTSLTQLHGQGHLSTVSWIIKDLESVVRHSKRLLCLAHRSRHSRGCLSQLPFVAPFL